MVFIYVWTYRSRVRDWYFSGCIKLFVVSNIYVTHFLSSTDFHDVLADVLEWPTVRSYPFIYELLLTNTGQSR